MQCLEEGALTRPLIPERAAVKGTTELRSKRTVVVVVDELGSHHPWPWLVVGNLATDPGIEIVALVVATPSVTADARSSAPLWRVADWFDASWPRALGLPPASSDHVSKILLNATGTTARALIDVVLDLSTTGVDPHLAVRARLGIWSLRSARAGSPQGRPLGFWECLANDPICTVHVTVRHEPSDYEWPIASGNYVCYRWSWSVNAQRLAQRASWLLADVLQHAEKDGAIAAARSRVRDVELGSGPSSADLVRTTPWQAILRVASRAGWEIARRLLQDDRWRILVVAGDRQGRTTGPTTILEPPLESYWADPFAVRQDGKCYVFVEEYFYAARRGAISYIVLKDTELSGGILRPKAHRLLDQPHHLSYPYLFSYQDRLYMIPESGQKRTIELWTCDTLPDSWRKVRTIMEGFRAVDTTLLEWNGRWWLFTNIDQSGLGDNCNELHLFHTDDPVRGLWQPHSRNPVVIDARRARMAGGFLHTSDGRPVRCSQVQGRRYGEAVSYNLIETLSETEYREAPWREVAPIGIAAGARTHHVSFRDGLIVADECTPNWRPMRALRRLRQLARTKADQRTYTWLFGSRPKRGDSAD